MIILAIIVALLGFVTFIIGLIPNLPVTPEVVITGGAWAIDQVTAVISLLRVVYSTELLAAIVIISIAIKNFETIYHTTMWVVRKIPINVH